MYSRYVSCGPCCSASGLALVDEPQVVGPEARLTSGWLWLLPTDRSFLFLIPPVRWLYEKRGTWVQLFSENCYISIKLDNYGHDIAWAVIKLCCWSFPTADKSRLYLRDWFTTDTNIYIVRRGGYRWIWGEEWVWRVCVKRWRVN